jgi:hypothetical protein
MARRKKVQAQKVIEPKVKPNVNHSKFEVLREFRIVTPETVLKGRFCGGVCQCEGCLAQARKDSRNDRLTFLETEITKVDGTITAMDTHAVPYVETF